MHRSNFTPTPSTLSKYQQRSKLIRSLIFSCDLIIPLYKGAGGLVSGKACGNESACVGHTVSPGSMKFKDKRNEEVQFQISFSLSRAKL